MTWSLASMAFSNGSRCSVDRGSTAVVTSTRGRQASSRPRRKRFRQAELVDCDNSLFDGPTELSDLSHRAGR